MTDKNENAENIIQAKGMEIDEVNFKVKELIKKEYKKILLMYPSEKAEGLLDGIKGESSKVQLEILGNAGGKFANLVENAKVIMNGDIDEDALTGMKSSKVVVYGFCKRGFANGASESEAYIFKNCGADSFNKLTNNCKVILGGQVDKNFANSCSGGVITVLNLKGGTTFIGEEDNWLSGTKDTSVYLRGKIKCTTDNIEVLDTTDEDEDKYLPLASEYSRLFGVSLDLIKEERFYRVVSKN